MPRYEYICNCTDEPELYVISCPISDYKSEIPCPCGNGTAKRVFNTFAVQEGHRKSFG